MAYRFYVTMSHAISNKHIYRCLSLVIGETKFLLKLFLLFHLFSFSVLLKKRSFILRFCMKNVSYSDENGG